MSSIAILKEIAELTNLTIDPSLIKQNIKTYIKLPKMISVAELFRYNNLSYEDHSDYIRVVTQHGAFDMPKDGYSDAYRLVEAVTSKTRGGRNMIVLPNIDGIMTGYTAADKWCFKEQWDDRKTAVSTRIWDGVYQTAAIDYDNDDDYDTLDLEIAPHYYNVLLTPREMRDFIKVNPKMTYVECELDCLSKKHFHGVHGLYKGADITFGPNGHKALCAPPMHLIEIWEKVPRLNPENAAMVETVVRAAIATLDPLLTTQKQIVSPPVTAQLDETELTGVGANYLESLLTEKLAWSKIVDRYSRPDSATWSSSERFSSTSSGKKKIKQRWTSIYSEIIMPLLYQEGTPQQEVLQAAWDLDESSDKTLANYCVRRLIAGDSTVVCTKDGNLKMQ
jgi:hypothetical protein